jgi:hypothetical protein
LDFWILAARSENSVLVLKSISGDRRTCVFLDEFGSIGGCQEDIWPSFGFLEKSPKVQNAQRSMRFGRVLAQPSIDAPPRPIQSAF